VTPVDTIHYAPPNNVVSPVTEASFSHNLIQALEMGAADSDKDGQIGLDELVAYLQSQTPQTDRLQPCLRTFGSQDRFIIARNPHLFVPAQAVKWDLISGAILTPTTIIIIGAGADLRTSVGLAGLFLLLYALLYLAPD
jgi:hypothetical protein